MHIARHRVQQAFALAILFTTTTTIAPASAQPDAKAWSALQAKAKAEGTVVVAGPPVPPLRAGIVEGFKKAYGIDVNYLPLRGGEVVTRLERESKLGKVSIDVNLGSSSCWELARKGQVADMVPILVDPALADKSLWKDGKPRMVGATQDAGLPADFKCFLQLGEWVMTDLFVNSKMIKPGEIKSWKDLLKPEYKGKIVAFDPRRSGPGHTTVGYLQHKFGPAFLEKLYADQDVRLSTDVRQLAEWVARGTYPIGLSVVQSGVEVFRREGLPIERVFPEDGVGALTAGFSGIMKIKDAPNSAAADLLINWMASREAQIMYQDAMLEKSLRTDVGNGKVPEYVVPKPGVNYDFDASDPRNHYGATVPAVDALTKRLDR